MSDTGFNKINRIRKYKQRLVRNSSTLSGSVLVLLSAYNGSQFINEQLLSILNQDYAGKIKIYIRDDGSGDNTAVTARNLFIKWKTNNDADRHLKIIKGNNIGVAESFLKLIKNADQYAYYFFSDQDDVWETDKVSRAVSFIEKTVQKTGNQPVIYCGNYSLCDEALNVYKKSALQEIPNFKPLKMLFYNKIPGCCMAMNSQLLLQLKSMKLSHVMMHDSFALSYACFNGYVIYDEESKVLHRIHNDNVVGDGHKIIIPHKWIFEKASLIMHKEKYDVAVMASEFIKAYKRFGGNNTRFNEDLILLSTYKESWKNTFRLLKHPDTTENLYDRTTMSIRAKILLRLF